MIESYKRKYQMKLDSWMLHHQRNIHFKMKYRGADMQKNPMDLVIYSEIIHEQEPDCIIEIGGAGGGTAKWLCDQLSIIGKKDSIVISVDITHAHFKFHDKRLQKVTGDSTTDETGALVYGLAFDKKKVLIIHDGSHKKVDIKKDFARYSALVQPGGYFIIEDGVMDVFDWKDHRTSGHDCGMYAGLEIEKENDNWEIDYEKERYIITYNPCGYLRRTK